jgi:hypothetical protein
VDCGDFPAVVGDGVLKRVLCNADTFFLCDDFERLDDAGNSLVLEARVFSLCIFANDDNVDVLVASVNARDVVRMDDIRVQVKSGPQLYIDRGVLGADWCEERALTKASGESSEARKMQV